MNDEQIRELVEGIRQGQDNANGSLAKIAESVDGLVARVEQSMDFVKLSRLTDSLELIALRGASETNGLLMPGEREMVESRMRQIAWRLARRGRAKRQDERLADSQASQARPGGTFAKCTSCGCTFPQCDGCCLYTQTFRRRIANGESVDCVACGKIGGVISATQGESMNCPDCGKPLVGHRTTT